MRLKLDIEITDDQYNHLTRDGILSDSDAIKRLIVRNFNKSSKPGVLSIEDFLFSNFDFNLDRRIPASKVYRLYLYECEKLNCTPVNKRTLYDELRDTSGLRLNHSTGNCLYVYGLEE